MIGTPPRWVCSNFMDNLKGTPLVVMENRKPTIIGIFHQSFENMGEFITDYLFLYDKINADVFHWIADHADGIYDSSCETFKSCRCGLHVELQTKVYTKVLNHGEGPYYTGCHSYNLNYQPCP